MSKPILCLDFDGVCNFYVSGWQGSNIISDDPVTGLFEFLDIAKDFFDIQIFSTRSNQDGGILAMKEWFAKHFTKYIFEKRPELQEKFYGLSCPDWLIFPTEKPPAFLTIDDRAITFDGTWPDIDILRNFKPWYEQWISR